MTPTPILDRHPMPLVRAVLLAAWFAALCVQPEAASAQESGDTRASALALFEQGRELTAHGRYAEACPKFEAAAKLLYSAGILLNLADCFAHTGRTASAWAVFRDAAGAAMRAGRDLEAAEARRRQAELSPHLPYLLIEVPEDDRPPGLIVHRDEHAVAPGAWNIELPIDPGEHRITASAPGRQPWTTTIESAQDSHTRVTIPLLSPASEPALVDVQGGSDARPASDDARARSPWIWVAGGVGLAAIGTGLVLGYAANSRYDDDRARCARDNVCDASKAQQLGDFATAATLIGAAGLVTSAILWLTTDTAAGEQASVSAASLRVAAGASTDGADLQLHGAF